jgi:hypothetical protein
MATFPKLASCAVAISVLVATGCATEQHAPQSPMPPPLFPMIKTDEYVGAVIPESYAAATFPIEMGYPADGFWTPREADIAKAEAAIRAGLERAVQEPDQLRNLVDHHSGAEDFARQEIPKILSRYSTYARQYVGITLSNKRWVWCNFFPLEETKPGNLLNHWRKDYVRVYDGGCSYWKIQCEPDTAQCTGFTSNAYA